MTSRIPFTGLVVLLLLAPGPRAAAETCQQVCTRACGPIQDVGKKMFDRCMQGGLGANGKPVEGCVEKCGKCNPLAGAVFPKFYVLGLIYAPPGCTNAPGQTCSSQSSVDYQAGSSMGTKASVEESFESGVNLSVKLDFGIASVSGSYSSSDTSTDSHSQTITKGETLDMKLAGNRDGVDHDLDTFILLLNPAVALQQNQQFTVDQECVPTGVVNWHVGLNSAIESSLALYTIPVKELKDPASMRPAVAQQLKALNFTSADFQTILALDPFANGNATIDPDRFVPTTYSFPYQPTLVDQDCNNGVCSCVAFQDAVKNELQTENQHSDKTEYKVSVSASGLKFNVPFTPEVSGGKEWTWTSTSTDSSTTDDSQTATVAVMCPSSGYQGPETEMSVYWDKLFGSFLFVPIVLSPPQTMNLAQGTVVSPNGHPARHEKVSLSVAGKTFHTYTDGRGGYRFFAHAGALKLKPGATGQLTIRGVRHSVKLGSAAKTQIRI